MGKMILGVDVAVRHDRRTTRENAGTPDRTGQKEERNNERRGNWTRRGMYHPREHMAGPVVVSS